MDPNRDLYRRTYRYVSGGEGRLEPVTRQWGPFIAAALTERGYALAETLGNCHIYRGAHQPPIIAVMRATIGTVTPEPYRFPPDLEVVILFAGDTAWQHFLAHGYQEWRGASASFVANLLGAGPTEIVPGGMGAPLG